MNNWLLKYQIIIVLAFFILMLGIMLRWETLRTWRPWLVARWLRFSRNASLFGISILLIKLIFPVLTVGAAITVERKGLGLLYQTPILKTLPFTLKVILGVIGMDFMMYVQHRVLHHIQLFWRMHRVHHMDKQLDVSTALRFHPLEALFTMGAKVLGIAFVGASPLSAIIYECLYYTALFFAHINVRLKPKFDLKLRTVFVTPGMHRIHHSDIKSEHNSNYGFVFSWWDKLLNTYTMLSQTGERKLILGLEGYREPKYQTVENMLLMPFNPKFLRKRHKKLRKTYM